MIIAPPPYSYFLPLDGGDSLQPTAHLDKSTPVEGEEKGSELKNLTSPGFTPFQTR
jgi:hypothetical protein